MSDLKDLKERLREFQGNPFSSPHVDQMLEDADDALTQAEALIEELATVGLEMSGDYMTSDTHHPNYVLVPVTAFNDLQTALASYEAWKGAQTSGNEQPTCWHDGCDNPAVVLRSSGNWCAEHETPPPAAAEMGDHEVRETGETTDG